MKRYLIIFICCFILFCVLSMIRYGTLDIFMNLFLASVVAVFQKIRDKQKQKWEK